MDSDKGQCSVGPDLVQNCLQKLSADDKSYWSISDERVGNLCIVAKDEESKRRVFTQMELHCRYSWSNPSNHGGRIVAHVLNSPDLYKSW